MKIKKLAFHLQVAFFLGAMTLSCTNKPVATVQNEVNPSFTSDIESFRKNGGKLEAVYTCKHLISEGRLVNPFCSGKEE